MIDNILEEPDKNQIATEDLFERVDRIYNAWLDAKFGAPVKLERDLKAAKPPEFTVEQMGSEPWGSRSPDWATEFPSFTPEIVVRT